MIDPDNLERDILITEIMHQLGAVDGEDILHLVERVRRELTAARAECERLCAENDTLRGIAAKVMPCHYCGVDNIAKCPHGFPGCSLADDVFCAEELYATELATVKAERDALANTLEYNERYFVYGRPAIVPDTDRLDWLDKHLGIAERKGFITAWIQLGIRQAIDAARREEG